MQTAFVFVVLPATLFAKCCPVEGLLSGHVPSRPPAPNSPSSKRAQRRPAAFRFTLMPPFKGYRKQNRITDVLNHWGSHSCLQPGQAVWWRGECPQSGLRLGTALWCSGPRPLGLALHPGGLQPAFSRVRYHSFSSAALTFPQIFWSEWIESLALSCQST